MYIVPYCVRIIDIFMNILPHCGQVCNLIVCQYYVTGFPNGVFKLLTYLITKDMGPSFISRLSHHIVIELMLPVSNNIRQGGIPKFGIADTVYHCSPHSQ